ncbi:MAG: GNAT family N-acetyltransferase [Candidatus Hydrogenedentes bacterium]|nr:GNAT family N-acetyltransferase [Candidatus Hydrogenedentota bacterium]
MTRSSPYSGICEFNVNAITLRAERIEQAPENLSDFVDEIGSGLAALYGTEAGANYRRIAPPALRASLSYPSVRMVGVVQESAGPERKPGPCTAMAVAVNRLGIAQISLIHVLRCAVGLDQESVLIRRMVDLLREEGVDGIICEAVPMSPLDLDRPFGDLGFQRIARVLMIAPLSENGLARPVLRESRPLTHEDVPAFAEAIVATYHDHPGYALHAEVRTLEGAYAFLESALSGGFGATRPAFSRVIARDGHIVAGLVGSEVAPGVGFVLQLVVVPKWQNRGLGSILVREAAQSFHEAGYRELALGVTADNPARRLYERLGFRSHRDVNAYVWWKDAG